MEKRGVTGWRRPSWAATAARVARQEMRGRPSTSAACTHASWRRGDVESAMAASTMASRHASLAALSSRRARVVRRVPPSPHHSRGATTSGSTVPKERAATPASRLRRKRHSRR